MPNELTNPNNVVTEERLAQFYQQILPYMGGMPDVLANKFNRADLYSTDEKLIGRWIDGKPLYQKTIENVTPSSQTVILTGVDSIVKYSFIRKYGSSLPNSNVMYDGNDAINNSVYVDLASGDLKLVSLSSKYTAGSGILTVQYTKSADSAVEIGSDTDYSTTEKIVGTWIDGKPIWQKTITGNTGSGNHSWNINVPDMEQAISISGYLISGELSDTLIPVGFYSNATNGFFSAMVNATDKTIFLRKPSNYDNKQAYITIQYTKTS